MPAKPGHSGFLQTFLSMPTQTKQFLVATQGLAVVLPSRRSSPSSFDGLACDKP